MKSEPAPPRLVAITLPDLPAPLGRVGRILVDDPQRFTGWSISFRGASVLLVTPRGWTRETHDQYHMHAKGPPYCTLFIVPRVECREQWAAEDVAALDKVMQRYDTGEMRRPVGPEAAPVPVKDPKDLGDA